MKTYHMYLESVLNVKYWETVDINRVCDMLVKELNTNLYTFREDSITTTESDNHITNLTAIGKNGGNGYILDPTIRF